MQRLDAGDVELAHRHAGGDHHRVAGDLAAVGELHDPVGVLAAQPDHLLGGEDLGAEAARLGDRAVGEVGACQPGGKAEVVLDQRAGAGLAAGRALLDDQRAQTLGGAVDRVGQAGRPAADHHQVVERQLRLGLEPDPGGELLRFRGDEMAAVLEEHHRQLAGLAGQVRGQSRHRLVALDLDPLVRNLVAGKKLLDGIALRGPTRADDADPLERQPDPCRPFGEEVVEHRIEPLLGGVPRLHQIVVERHLVDRGDRRRGVGVGGEQHFARLGVELPDLAQQLGAGHIGHPLIDQEESDRRAALLELARCLERLGR